MPTRRALLRGTAGGLLAVGLAAPSGCVRSNRAGSAAGSAGPTVLRWWDYYLEPARQAGVRALIADIEANVAGVKIERRVLPFNDLPTELKKALDAGDAPDLAIVDNPAANPLAAMGALVDLTDRVADWGQADNFYAGPWSSCQYRGRTIAIPNNSNCIALYYNTAILQAAGVAAPRTWDELAAACRRLTTPAHHALALSAIKGEEGVFQFLPFLWQTGGDLKTFGTDGATALAFLDGLVKTGGLSADALNWTQQDANTQFISGQAAMQVNGPWQLPTLKGQSAVNWNVVPLPAGRTEATALGGENWVVLAGTKHADKAWEVIVRSQQAQALVPYLDALGLLPARHDFAGAGSWANDPVLQLFLKQLDKAKARTYGPRYPAMSDAISQAEHAALSGTAAPADAARTAAATVTQNLSA